MDVGISELVSGFVVHCWCGANTPLRECRQSKMTELVGAGVPDPRLNRRHAVRLYVFADELNDVVHGGAGLEDTGHSYFL